MDEQNTGSVNADGLVVGITDIPASQLGHRQPASAPITSSIPSSPERGEKRHCTAVKADGTPCKAWAMQDGQTCSMHSDKAEEIRSKGVQASAEARRNMVEARKRAPMDVYRDTLVRNAEALSARLLKAALGADDAVAVRAIEALNSRVLGKPKETVESHTVPDDFRRVDEMSREEREELYQRLMAAEGIDVT